MLFKKFVHKKNALTFILLLAGFTVLAQDAPAIKTETAGNNLLATFLIIIAVVLLFVLYGMGQVLLALTRQLLDKDNAATNTGAIAAVVILSFISGNALAQDAAVKSAVNVLPNYGGLSATTFYCLVAVVATEVIAIFFLFFSIRRIYTELMPAKAAAVIKESKLAALWVKLNKKLTRSIPLEQEADALLDHNYDGIQELDNALPPWWKYGFIVTIFFAVIYLLNFHVLGNGKNPTEEYLAEMSKAKIDKEEFEAQNKDKIDDNNVPLADATGINNGREFYTANCVACHGPKGEGGAGPNLTDDYWLHKGSLNDVYNTIKKGYPDKGMQSWAVKFNPKEISQIASFITTLKGTHPAGAKAPQGDLVTAVTVAVDSSKIALIVNKLPVTK